MTEQRKPGPVPQPPGAKKPAASSGPAKKSEPAKKTTPAKKSAPTKKPAASTKPAADTPPADEPKASSRPMTAADYARTSSTSPASTAVFPKITDVDETPAAPETPSGGTTRQARLSLVHVDPWSVTQLAFVTSVALMIVAVVAVTVFWLVLSVTGVWGNLNDTVNSVLSSEDGSFDVENYLGFGRVVGLTLVLSAINVVLTTALAAVGTRLYNAATHIVGGVQVTFRERV